MSIVTKVTKKNWRELMLAGQFNKKWKELMIAISLNDIDFVKDLISKGCGLDAQNNHGQTALMVAITHKRIHTLK